MNDYRRPNEGRVDKDEIHKAHEGGGAPIPAPIPSSLEDHDVISKLPKIISFEELARCGEEIWIENNGDLYRLRRTKQGKLLLTK